LKGRFGPVVLFDDSLWPLLVVKFVGTTSDLEFEAYLERMSEYLKRDTKYVCLFDSTEMKDSPMVHRQRQLEWLKANDALLRQWMIGTGFVLTSPIIRLAMNVITQLNKPPCPQIAVPTLKAALEWAAERFKAENLMLPAMLIRTRGLLQSVADKRAAAG
jgi:hypothetical protein